MKLLEENNRQGQASDLSQLMWYMDGMNRQFEAVLAELQEVREQLAREKAALSAISGPAEAEKNGPKEEPEDKEDEENERNQ